MLGLMQHKYLSSVTGESLSLAWHTTYVYRGHHKISIVSEVEAATVFGLASLVCEVRPWCWNMGSMARWKNSMFWGFVCSNQCLGARRAAWSGVALQSSIILEHFLHDASIIEIVVTLSPKGGLVELSKLDLIEIYSSGIQADTILIGPLHADKTAGWLSSFKTSWGVEVMTRKSENCENQLRWLYETKMMLYRWSCLRSKELPVMLVSPLFDPFAGARTLRFRCAPQPMVRNLLKLSILPWWSLLKDG